MKNFLPLAVTTFLLCLSNFIFSQSNVREDFLDAEFFLSEEDYREALYSYLKVYKAGYQDNANINYRIGMCYLNIPGEKEAAIPYLEKAITNISKNWAEGSFKESGASPDAYLYLGNAYRISYKLDDAINAYNIYKENLDRSRIKDIEYTEQQIKSCELAKKALLNPAILYKENLGKKYNSNVNNFQLIFSGEKNSMAYMNRLRFYDAAFFTKKINGTWSNPINITSQIESDGDQYACCLSYDGLKLFLVKIANFDADIYVSEYSMGRWMPSKALPKPVNSKYFESHASISPDGKTLYFSSNRKESLGEMDIFYSTLDDAGRWSEPVNLGPAVNTVLNEETPFISSDGTTLFFSSQGHETIGGYDYFKTVKQPDGTWSKAEALPYPVSTTDDDLFFFPAEKENSGYLTLYDPDGLGSGDLYYIELLPGKLAQAEGETILKQKPLVSEVVPPKEITVPVIEPEKVTEQKVVEAVPPEKIIEERVVEVIPFPASPKYFIKPVFFTFDSYDLTEYSKSKLDEIAKALKSYPKLSLEVRGYTDAMGTDNYNQVLSEKRARAVINYLVGQQIDQSRLILKGFGERENVAINTYTDGRDSKEGRKLNRRVEFKIVTEGGALITIEDVKVPESLKIK